MRSSAPARRVVAVAYSGGRDSTALLHATLAVADSLGGIEVLALHVHHGLHPEADAWLAHARRRCARWAAQGRPVGFDSVRIDGAPSRGESVEAWARRERYRALRAMALAHGASLVLLAHHRRDQAETFVLQALRASGVAGLSAMPRAAEREGLTWARPWLECDPELVAAYVRRHRLRHVEDASNADPRYARNRLRRLLWPALAQAFPQAEAAFAAAAGRAQEAQRCAEALAAIDLRRVARHGALDLAAWAALESARCSNALRAWLRERTGRRPAAALTERLLRELAPAAAPAQWALGEHVLRRYRGRLTCERAAPLTAEPARPELLAVSRAGTYAAPGWGGRLRLRRVASGGVALALPAQLRLAARSGGEDFQAAPGRPARSLKKQFQARGLAAWQRLAPLVYAGERLLFVPGLGIDARVLAGAGEPQFALEWLSDAR